MVKAKTLRSLIPAFDDSFQVPSDYRGEVIINNPHPTLYVKSRRGLRKVANADCIKSYGKTN